MKNRIGTMSWLGLLIVLISPVSAVEPDRAERSYRDLEDKSWQQVFRETARRWPAPYTAHYPIHPRV